MEGKSNYRHISIAKPKKAQDKKHPSISGAGRCNEDSFYQAFASSSREEGFCRLSLIWQSRAGQKCLQAHHYLLYFNHLGIKEYSTEDITSLGVKGWRKGLGYKTVSLGLSEASSLIQDAFAQNRRFNTRMAPPVADSHILLAYDTEGIERFRLCCRLFSIQPDLGMFVNIYLAALRRLDLSLLYDLSGRERKSSLGRRDEYLTGIEDEFLSRCTFLRSGITSVKTQGRVSQVQAFVVLSTPEEETVRINYEFQIIEERGLYYVEALQETSRQHLPAAHPENPQNYKVFAVLYRHKGRRALKHWLESQKGVFLGGELPWGEVYKWLNVGTKSWEEFIFTQAISAEFYLTDQELLVFSDKPEGLAGIIRLLAEDCRGLLVIRDQYFLEVDRLIRLLADEGEKGTDCGLSLCLKSKRAQALLFRIDPADHPRFLSAVGEVAGKTVNMGSGSRYYYICSEKLLAELYKVGPWAKLIVYRGYDEESLDFLKSYLDVQSVIMDHELENHFNLFTPVITEQRKWEIFRQVRNLGKEAALFRDMGLVPSLKEVALRLGILRHSLESPLCPASEALMSNS